MKIINQYFLKAITVHGVQRRNKIINASNEKVKRLGIKCESDKQMRHSYASKDFFLFFFFYEVTDVSAVKFMFPTTDHGKRQ